MDVRDEDFENVAPSEPRILIPHEGVFSAQFIDCESKCYDGWGEKLLFKWNVFTSSDRGQSVTLFRYYNLERDKGGRFKFGQLHDFRKDWVAANRGCLPSNHSKLPISIFRERIFLVEVVTVRFDSKRRLLSSSFYWSRIGRVIRPLEEDERWER